MTAWKITVDRAGLYWKPWRYTITWQHFQVVGWAWTRAKAERASRLMVAAFQAQQETAS